MIQSPHAVKVGVTRNLEERLATLQTGSPHVLEMVYHLPIAGDAFAVEAETHAILGRHRMEGEWFSVPADAAVAAINAAAFRLSPAGRSVDTAPVRTSWLRRVGVFTLIFTPAWIAIPFDQPGVFLILSVLELFVLGIWTARTHIRERFGFLGAVSWLSALVVGFALAAVLGTALGVLAHQVVADKS